MDVAEVAKPTLDAATRPALEHAWSAVLSSGPSAVPQVVHRAEGEGWLARLCCIDEPQNVVQCNLPRCGLDAQVSPGTPDSTWARLLRRAELLEAPCRYRRFFCWSHNNNHTVLFCRGARREAALTVRCILCVALCIRRCQMPPMSWLLQLQVLPLPLPPLWLLLPLLMLLLL